MSESNKLWVIDLGDNFVAEEHMEKQQEISRPAPAVTAPARPVRKPQAPASRPVAKTAATAAAPASGQLHFAMMLVLSYLLGPFALLLWPAGRRHRVWAATAAVSGIVCVAAAWQWRHILGLGSGLLLPLMVTMAVASQLAFAAWAQAVHLAFTSRTRSHTALPGWTRSGWGVTSLGLLAPGLGLYLTGQRKRAAAVLWSMWPALPAAVLVAHAGWTWHWLQSSGATPQLARALEISILGSAAILAVAYLGWFTQALTGLHLRSRRAGSTGRGKGDRLALVLLATVVAVAVFFPPADMASFLHGNGLYLEQQGYSLAPVKLVKAAHGLAPGQPDYAITLARLEGPVVPGEASEVQPTRDPVQDQDVLYGMLATRKAPAPQPEESQPVEQAEEAAAWTRPVTIPADLRLHDEPEPR